MFTLRKFSRISSNKLLLNNYKTKLFSTTPIHNNQEEKSKALATFLKTSVLLSLIFCGLLTASYFRLKDNELSKTICNLPLINLTMPYFDAFLDKHIFVNKIKYEDIKENIDENDEDNKH